MTLPGGIPTIEDYELAIRSQTFSEMEEFSGRFLKNNSAHLRGYARRWVRDPLHQWSRQWEYPYVYEQLSAYCDARGPAARILDAGSGVTFFPYFVIEHHKGARVTCCDIDGSLSGIFSRVNANVESAPQFQVSSLAKLDIPSCTFDLIYCISVLEHLRDIDRVVSELHRVLKPQGRLVLTFDLSIDGRSDIPIDRANGLLNVLLARFSPWDGFPKAIPSSAIDPDRYVTTEHFKGAARALLPWTRLKLIASGIKSILSLTLPKRPLRRLSVFCCTLSR